MEGSSAASASWLEGRAAATGSRWTQQGLPVSRRSQECSVAVSGGTWPTARLCLIFAEKRPLKSQAWKQVDITTTQWHSLLSSWLTGSVGAALV